MSDIDVVNQILASDKASGSGGSYDVSTYHPGPPIFAQYKAPNFSSGIVEYYKLDANAFPVQKFVNGAWMTAQPMTLFVQKISGNLYRRPIGMEPAITDTDKASLAVELASSGMFKPKTEYIRVGDEVPGDGTINLKAMLDETSYNSLLQYMTFMPRQFLHNFFMKNVYPSIPMAGVYGMNTEGNMVKDPIYGDWYQVKTYRDMVWAAFIEVFNTANLDYCNKNQIQPQDWELQKLTAYYSSQNQDQIDALQAKFDQYSQVTLVLDPKAKVIMDDFATLPKLGDPGLEVNRQNAIKQLLIQREYDTAQAIVDAYRYAKDTIIGPALEAPIEQDIVLTDGTVIVQKSSPPIT